MFDVLCKKKYVYLIKKSEFFMFLSFKGQKSEKTKTRKRLNGKESDLFVLDSHMDFYWGGGGLPKYHL